MNKNSSGDPLPSATAGEGARPAVENDQPRAGWVEWSVGVLNGVLGDYLHKRNNGLSTDLTFIHHNRPLALDRNSLARAIPNPTPRVCVLIHGLTCTERCFAFPGEPEVTYGSLLQRDLGYTPLYLRYNTGLHISQNGESLSHRMQELVANYPEPLDELVVIGHSMGGLILRSACHQAARLGHDWVKRLRRAFYLGSPHNGARFEKFGNVVTWVLASVPTAYTRLAADIINLRSAGIKDLRYTYLTPEDWQDADPDALLHDNRHPVPLSPGVLHYFVGGTLTANERHLIALLFGDLLVHASSAVPVGAEGEPPVIVFPKEHGRFFPGIAHMRLANCPEVYEHLKAWLSQGGSV